MSLYQQMVAKRMAMFYRKRDERGRFICGKKPMPNDRKKEEIRKEAIKIIKEIVRNLK